MMSWNWKRAAAGFAAASVLMAGMAACSSSRTDDGAAASDSSTAAEGGGGGDQLIGIAMPTRSLERWNKDGSNLEALLKDKGYRPTSSTPTTRSTSRSRRSRT